MPSGSALGASPLSADLGAGPSPTHPLQLRALTALEHSVLTALCPAAPSPLTTPYLCGVSATRGGRLIAGVWLEVTQAQEAIVRAHALDASTDALLLTLYHERWHLGAARYGIRRLWQPLHTPQGFSLQAYLQQQLWHSSPQPLPIKLYALGFRAKRCPRQGWMLALDL